MSREVLLYLKEPYDGAPRRGGLPHGETSAAPGLSPSHRLLAQAAGQYLRCAPEDFGEPALSPRGKPYFPAHPALCFSISHSGALWACAMAEAEVGLDVQEPRGQNAAGIARRFFHPLERAYLERRGPDEFFRVWAAKESVCKYRGTGIDGTFSQFSVTDGEHLLTRLYELWLYHFTPRTGYAACLCTGEAAVPRIVSL